MKPAGNNVISKHRIRLALGGNVSSPAAHSSRFTFHVSRSAFTLIEVLLALAIFSIVLVAINTVFFAALRLRQRVSETVEAALPVNQALNFIRRDLKSAVPPGGVLAGNFSSNGPRGSSGTGTSARTGGTAMGAQGGGLDFFTSGGALTEDAPWGDIQEVNYQLMEPLNPGSAYGKDLVRSVTRNLLATATQEADLQRLMNNVQSLDFFYFDGSQWRSDWDTSAGDSGLPLAVRVRVQMAANLAAGEPSQQPLELVVLLDSRSLTNQTQVAGGTQ